MLIASQKFSRALRELRNTTVRALRRSRPLAQDTLPLALQFLGPTLAKEVAAADYDRTLRVSDVSTGTACSTSQVSADWP